MIPLTLARLVFTVFRRFFQEKTTRSAAQIQSVVKKGCQVALHYIPGRNPRFGQVLASKNIMIFGRLESQAILPEAGFLARTESVWT